MNKYIIRTRILIKFQDKDFILRNIYIDCDDIIEAIYKFIKQFPEYYDKIESVIRVINE